MHTRAGRAGTPERARGRRRSTNPAFRIGRPPLSEELLRIPARRRRLSFRDNARTALEHYQRVLGGSLDISTFDSMPEMGHDPAEGELVMHGQLTTDDGMVLMASDTPSGMEYGMR